MVLFNNRIKMTELETLIRASSNKIADICQGCRE